VLVENDEQTNSTDLVARLMMSSFSQTSNPLAEKITESHITKVLDNSEKDSEREFEFNKLELKDQQSSKWFFLATFIISLIFIGFIIVFLSGVDKETMRFVLGIIVGFIGGFGAKGLLPQSKKKSD
jgi:small-conductance mechanosensitive channel